MRQALLVVSLAMLLSVSCTSPSQETEPVAGPGPEKEAPEAATSKLPQEEKFRAAFAEQPRHLFGCGIIWAEWRWAGRKDQWSFDGRCMDKIKEMGATAVPINIPWHDVEPEEGKWYFEYVDHQVAEAEKRGLAMFAYMGLTPNWALPPEAPKDKPGIGFRFPPPDDRKDQFVTYCRKVARRYKGRIEHYQFWNEQNGCSWVNDGCANGHLADNTHRLYVKWLATWYTAMKAEDPDCVLAVGGLDYHEGVKGNVYLEGLYAEGAQDYFDAMAIHPYGITTPIYLKAIEDTRRIMVEHGDGHKGIWIREYGWALEDEKEKSRRLTETLTTLADPKYYYVTMAMYLCLTDPGGDVRFGLCRNDLLPRTSYYAYQELAKKGTGLVPESRKASEK
jgi:hypothetical protein